VKWDFDHELDLVRFTQKSEHLDDTCHLPYGEIAMRVNCLNRCRRLNLTLQLFSLVHFKIKDRRPEEFANPIEKTKQ
jgi:hypothetical protein